MLDEHERHAGIHWHFSSKWLAASSPPADAPIPTTANAGVCADFADGAGMAAVPALSSGADGMLLVMTVIEPTRLAARLLRTYGNLGYA
jgi:hypothetical protein